MHGETPILSGDDLVQHVNTEYLSHLAYWLPQSALGVDDGMFAGMYDIDCSLETESRFGHEAGADLIRTAIARVGENAVRERSHMLFPSGVPDDGWRLPDSPSPADFDELGRRTAESVVSKMADIFPEGGPQAFAPFYDAIARFARDYAKAEHAMNALYGEEEPGPSGP